MIYLKFPFKIEILTIIVLQEKVNHLWQRLVHKEVVESLYQVEDLCTQARYRDTGQRQTPMTQPCAERHEKKCSMLMQVTHDVGKTWELEREQ